MRTGAVIASGPSLTRDDSQAARRADITIAVNDAWRLCPEADILYAADAAWWGWQLGAPAFRGRKCVSHRPVRNGQAWGCEAADLWGLDCIRTEPGCDLSADPGYIYEGFNSAFQAMGLLVHAGVSRIVFLGLDLGAACPAGRSHFFGDHPGRLNQWNNFASFRAAFEHAAPQLAARGIEALNCSRRSTLDCFPRATIEEALA